VIEQVGDQLFHRDTSRRASRRGFQARRKMTANA
jgi:hypothetical protein